MKKRISFVLILISLSSICVGEEYSLVMNKNDCLCKHMLRLYNGDIKKYDKVKYELHKEFNWIKWVGNFDDAKAAYFDINNDSKDEAIVYSVGSISNFPTNDYDIFKYGDQPNFNETIDGSVYLKKRLEGFSSLDDGVHVKIADLSEEDVKKLPEKLRSSIETRIEANRKSGDKYIYFGDAVKKINFLRFKNRFYMTFEEFTNAEMLDRALDRFYREGGDPKTSRRSNKWLEDGFNNLEKCSWVAEYQKDNTLINKCLYIRQDTPAKKATPSFDCEKAKTEVEKLICGDDELSRLDDSLNEAYQKALKQTDSKRQLIEAQRQWLKKERNACRNTECLKKAYQSRIKELSSLSEKGPKSQATEQPDKPKLIETEPQTESTLQRLNKSEEKFLEHKRLLQDAEKGSLEQIKNLPAERFNVNVRGPYGRTLLMEAAQSGNLDQVKFLVAQGIDVNTKDYSGRGVLTGATKVDNDEIVKFLISKGADVNVWFLLYAAKSGNSKVVKLLLDEGLDVNAKTEDGKTVLMLAATSGDLKAVKHLVAAGADLNATGEFGVTALMNATTSGYVEIVKFLINNGADLNAKTVNGRTLLMYATCSKNLDLVKFLVSKEIEVNAKTKDGETALMNAARYGNLEVVKYLIDKGADINAKTKDSETALMEAAGAGQVEIAKFVAANGANVNAKTESGRTVLIKAAMSGNKEVMRFLIDKGANVNAKAEHGRTALLFAIEHGYPVMKLLIDRGANVNAQFEGGRTVLMSAAEKGDLDIAELLIESGADVNAKSTDGDTALKLAQEREYVEIEELLIDHGAKE